MPNVLRVLADASSPSSEGRTLEQLASLARERGGDESYGGEVMPREAWDCLASHGGLLVDVRTPPEWLFVGLPHLRDMPGKLVTLAWKHYPTFAVNDQFAPQLLAAGATPATPLFFLCRSGGRSLDAARAMHALGYRYCFNVSGGFEGEPDAQGHRGSAEGWKASGLPWRQE